MPIPRARRPKIVRVVDVVATAVLAGLIALNAAAVGRELINDPPSDPLGDDLLYLTLLALGAWLLLALVSQTATRAFRARRKPMPQAKYDFNAYLTEARPAPFVLEFGPDDRVEIQPPDGETALKLDEARTSRSILELLCGEHYGRIHAELRSRPFTVMNALADDMRRHFNLMDTPEGGSGASSTR